NPISDLILDLGPDTSLRVGQSILLSPQFLNFTAIGYQWKADQYDLSCSSCPTINISPRADERYILTVEDEQGCTISDTILVNVIPKPKLYIPNAFSPNADGINDFFQIEGTAESVARVKELQIYNRWGSLIYQQSMGDLRWDGKVNGELAQPDVYLYKIQWLNPKNQPEQLKGTLTLVR
ncbi:MAG: gliding motility-associated C-terminal domain-containing protein, partial [Bacteroidota bacterium]